MATMEPMTVKNNRGITTVYKGHCISATCYQSVDQVKIKLGETPDRRQTPNTDFYSPSSSQKPSVHLSSHRQSSPRQSARQSNRQSTKLPLLSPLAAEYDDDQPRPTRRVKPEEILRDVPAIPFTDTERRSSLQPSELDQLHNSHSEFNGSHSSTGNNSNRLNNSSSDFRDSVIRATPKDGGEISLLSLPDATVSIHPVIAEFNAALSAGDYIKFLNALDQKGKMPEHVVEGFGLFRKKLVEDQLARPNGVVLAGNNWMKTMTTPFERHRRERDVIISGLVTMITLSNLPGNYKGPITKKGGVDVLLKLLDDYATDEEIIELVCAAFGSLTENEKGGLNGKYEKVGKVVRRLADLLSSNDQVGRQYSLLPLCNLSNQRKRLVETGRSPWYDVRDCLSTDAGTRAIIKALQSHHIHSSAAESGLSLLWKLSVPKEEQEGQDTFLVTDELVKSIVACIKRFTSYGVVLAGSRVLANLALRIEFPTEWAAPAVTSINHFLSDHSSQVDEEMAICALHTFCNLHANASTRTAIISDNEVIQHSLSLFDKFPGCEALVELACLTISHAGVDNQGAKRLIVDLGGLDIVRKAFGDYVGSGDGDCSLEVKDAIFCAVASLSGCETGAQQILQSPLLGDIQSALAVEPDEDCRSVLEVVIRNTSAASSNGFATSVAPAPHTELRQQPGLFSYLIQSADSEASVVALLGDLNGLGEAGFEAYGNGGFDALLSTMSQFRDSAVVQEQGCQALAQVYYYLPFTNLDAPTQLPAGGWAVIYGLQAVETLQNAIRVHRSHPDVQGQSFCALSNFLAPICELDAYSEERLVVGQWLEACLNDILDVMNKNAIDDSIQKRGINLLWSLFCVCSPETLQPWKLRALQRIFDTMRQMKDDCEILKLACDALMGLQGDQESLNFMSESIIVQLVESLLSDDVEVVSRTSAVFSILVKNVFIASIHAMQVPNVIPNLISCMNSNQSDCDIQVYICSALESLINFEDFSLRAGIAQDGGMHALSDALRLHGTNPKLVEFACRALSLVIPSSDGDTIASMRGPLGDTLMGVLQAHVDNADAESAVMDALWTCCSQDDYFKHIMINSDSLSVVVQVMTLQLGSAEVQRSGCSLLWILSSYGTGKDAIGHFGGVAAVVNALLAHNESTTVQKEGLCALKNLATASNNRSMIEQAGGEDAVLYALWIHYRHPQVISSAYSALNNIAVDSATKTVKLMNEKTIESSVFAMSRFSMDETVQKNICFYLKSLSYLPGNLEIMYRYSDRLIPLLYAAADTFPQYCHDRAASVIGKIQQYG
jgi:hypothetical protein